MQAPRFVRGMVALFVASCATTAASAQSRPPAVSIDSLRALVERLSHDSLAGRPTPSRQLDIAAAMVVRSLAASGLEPLGDNGSFFQRYPLLHTTVRESVAGLDMGRLGHWKFGDDYWHVGGMGGPPVGQLVGPVVIVTGAVDRQSVASIDVRGKIVIFRSPLSATGLPLKFDAGFALGGAGARAVLVPSGRPPSLWARLRNDPDEFKPLVKTAWVSVTDTAPPIVETAIKFMPLLEVWGGRFESMLQQAGLTANVDPSDGPPRVTALGIEGRFDFYRKIDSVAWAPNVVAVLPGADPALRQEYVVMTAHLDGLGREGFGPGGPLVLNGADDNASGVAAIVEIARVLAAGPRPRRSVLVVAVSGEELGLWGSEHFTVRSPVPIKSIVANVNLDMVGRANGDSVYLTGASDPRIAAAITPLIQETRGLTFLDQAAMNRRWPNERLDDRSDHVNFRRKQIPTLSLFTGLHDDYHAATDDAARVNYPALARITEFAASAVRRIANAAPRR